MTFTRIALVFWIARAWRLLPSAWFWLTAPLLLCLVFNHSGAYGSFQANFGTLCRRHARHGEFSHRGGVWALRSGTAFPQWSLSLEEQFYLLLPFVAFFCRRYLFIPLILIGLAGFFVPNTALMFQIRLWPVAFGVLLALWSAHPTYRECAPTGLAKKPVGAQCPAGRRRNLSHRCRLARAARRSVLPGSRRRHLGLPRLGRLL